MNDSSRSVSWRRLGVLGAVWALLGGGALVLSSCYGRNCEGSPRQYGIDASDGRMLDENTWESSPLDGEWIPFPRQVVYTFTIPFGGRVPSLVLGSVSGQQRPNTGNFTTGAGNLLEFTAIGPNQAAAINDTCSDYYIRVFAWAAPFGSTGPDASASTDSADSGLADAGADAQ